MAYSEADDAFGWCSSQNSAQDALNCARIQCIDVKGADCRVVLECRGGWLAIAIGNPGFGMVCERDSTLFARQWALFNCMAATHRRCTIYDTVNDSSGVVRAREDNEEFDRAWHTQAMLLMGDYAVGEADGVLGPKTRQAIRAFQEDYDLEPTGEPDDATFAALLEEVGGDAGFVARILSVVEFPPEGSEADLLSAYSAGPGGPSELPLSEEETPPTDEPDTPEVVAGELSCEPGAPGFRLPGQGDLPVQDYVARAAGGDKEAFVLLCNLANGGDANYAKAVGDVLSRRSDEAGAKRWLDIAAGGGGLMPDGDDLTPEERAKLTGK